MQVSRLDAGQEAIERGNAQLINEAGPMLVSSGCGPCWQAVVVAHAGKQRLWPVVMTREVWPPSLTSTCLVLKHS